jgi:uncharacterized protein (TIGR03437 family)
MEIPFAKALCLALALTPLLVIGYPGGPPIRRTGAPGDRTCLDASCHVGVRLDDSMGLSLETGGSFRYLPGRPSQRWVLRVNDNLARAFGFQLSVRSAANPTNGAAGQLRVHEPDMQVVCDNQVLSGPNDCVPPAAVQFVQHTAPSERGEFPIEWTPPSDNIGDLIVYVAANASVTGQRNSRIHLRSFIIRPAMTQGVVDAAGLRPRISAGSWGTIFGNGLAETTRSWRSDEINARMLPVVLDGVRVRVNGRLAAIHYISPTQINFQVPDDNVVGEVPVEVWRQERLTASYRVSRAELAPAIFVLPDNGRDYAAAIHSDGCLVGRPRPEGSVCSRPAHVGDIIAVYVTGFGPTEPRVPAGQVLKTPARTNFPVAVRIGGQNARVHFSGLIGAGLYQINVTIPDVPRGDHTIEALIERQSTQSHVYLSVE